MKTFLHFDLIALIAFDVVISLSIFFKLEKLDDSPKRVANLQLDENIKTFPLGSLYKILLFYDVTDLA